MISSQPRYSTGTRNDVGPIDIARTSNAIGPNDIAGTATTVFAPSRGRGRPRKATSTSEEPTRDRGRPRKDSSTSKAAEAPARGRGRPRQAISTSEVAEAPSRGRGRPTKNSSTSEAAKAPVRGRGRPTKDSCTSKATEAPARGRGRLAKDFSTSEATEAPVRDRGRPTKDSSTSEADEASSKGRGRPRTTHAKGMGMLRRTYITYEWFENPTSYSAPVAAQSNVVRGGPPVSSTAHVNQSYMERERTTPNKRPRTIGMDLFVVEDGFKTYSHSLPSSRILHSSARQPRRSVEVSRDLGFKPRTGVRWKGKEAITTGQFEEMRLTKRKKLSSTQSREPWK
ncbi:hypothetical protein HAX54_041422 [Datura stramonium]|uniref:Uncharacterized protein n=1 Tax=Datura stramonium TaxID=4076 RepID=A0ABS8VUH5_DATST|nr:hypothetical protein [Datura stramonium]